MAEVVIGFATNDNRSFKLHAFMRGEGSMRDENHISDIIDMFCRGNEHLISKSAPPSGWHMAWECFMTIEKSRRGHSTYRNWGYVNHGCPYCVGEAGFDIYKQIKSVLREARKNKEANNDAK